MLTPLSQNSFTASLLKVTSLIPTVMKRITIALILAHITLLCACLTLVNLVTANPINLGEAPPDAYTQPPIVTITSPENKNYYNSTILLSLNVSEGQSTTALYTKLNIVCYKADWMTDNVTLYSWDPWKFIPNIHTFSTELNLTDVPIGTHSIIVYAVETGNYDGGGLLQYYTFTISNSATATFTVGSSTPPTPTPTPSPTPTVPELSWLSLLPLLLPILSVAVIVRHRKKLT
jgi:hypothetical protein